MTIGNDVMAYTASPSFAVLVEMACFKVSGTLVPAGRTRPPAFTSFWLAELSACAPALDWARQVEDRKRHNIIQRINFVSQRKAVTRPLLAQSPEKHASVNSRMRVTATELTQSPLIRPGARDFPAHSP